MLSEGLRVLLLLLAPATPQDAAPPKDERPALSPDRLTIEVLHREIACDAFRKGEPCQASDHWQLLIDKVETPTREKALVLLRQEAEKHRDPDHPKFSDREVLVWGSSTARYSSMNSAMTLCAEAGLYKVQLKGQGRSKIDSKSLEGLTLPKPTPKSEDPDEIRVYLQMVEGRAQRKLDESKWFTTDREFAEALMAKGAMTETPLLFSPADDAPWHAVIDLVALVNTLGGERLEFSAPFNIVGLADPPDVTPAEALRFGQTLDATLAEGKQDAVVQALDKEAFLARAIGSTKLSPPLEKEIRRIADEQLSAWTRPQGSKGEEWRLKFLGLKNKKDSTRLVFRRHGPGLDYWEAVPAKGADGTLRIVDIASGREGGLWSNHLSYWFVPYGETLAELRKKDAPSMLEILLGRGSAGLLYVTCLEGNWKKACSLVTENFRTFRSDGQALRLYLAAAKFHQPETFNDVLEKFVARRWYEEKIDLFRLDLFRLRKDAAKALEAVESLDRQVQDPYLDLVRSDLYLEQSDLAKAREFAERAAKREETLDLPWMTLLQVCNRQKDYKSTAATLAATEKRFGWKPGNLPKIQGFEEFVKSPEYQEWLKSRR